MSIIAAALRELIAAGVTGDALVTAIERIESQSIPKLTPGAIRQRRYRERHRDVTLRNVTSPVTSHREKDSDASKLRSVTRNVTQETAHIDKKDSSSSSTSEKKKERKKVSISLPRDASLSDTDHDYAQAHGWSAAKIISEWERFKNHAAQHDRKCANWHAAWRNWVTSPYQKLEGKNGPGNRVMEAFDYAIDRAGGGEVESDPPMRDITPRRP